MAVESLVAPLLRVQIFQGLKPLQLTEIARRAERLLFRDGEVITEAGDAADGAVLIVSGDSVRVSGGHEEPVEVGSLIGEMAMLIDHSYGSSVVARGVVKALRINRAEMQAQMQDDIALTDHLVAKVSARLTAVAEELRRIDNALAASLPPPPRREQPRALEPLRPIAAPARGYPTLAAH